MTARLLPWAVGAGVVLLLLGVGFGFALLGPKEADYVASGNYISIDSAERAVGFPIPMSRDFSSGSVIHGVNVFGGSTHAQEETLTEPGEYGRSNEASWVIAVTYGIVYNRAGFNTTVIVYLSPRTDTWLETPFEGTPQDIRINESEARLYYNQLLPPAAVFWQDKKYDYLAISTLDSDRSIQNPLSRPITMDEFLTFVRSIR